MRPLKADFNGIGKRYDDEELAKMAAAAGPGNDSRPAAAPDSRRPRLLARRRHSCLRQKRMSLPLTKVRR